MPKQVDTTLCFLTGQLTADAELLIRIEGKSTRNNQGGLKRYKQTRAVQHVVPFQQPTGYDTMEGGTDSATTLVKVQDPNFLKPRGTSPAQPLRNAQANPRDHRGLAQSSATRGAIVDLGEFDQASPAHTGCHI